MKVLNNFWQVGFCPVQVGAVDNGDGVAAGEQLLSFRRGNSMLLGMISLMGSSSSGLGMEI